MGSRSLGIPSPIPLLIFGTKETNYCCLFTIRMELKLVQLILKWNKLGLQLALILEKRVEQKELSLDTLLLLTFMCFPFL